MLDWFKNISKEYPEFWKQYLSKFEKKSKRYVSLSITSTGPNLQKDVILSFGAVAIEQDSIRIGDSFEVILLQYIYLHDNGLSNEFIIKSTQPKLGEREAIQAFVEYIGNATLVGHRIDNAVNLINVALEKLDCGRLKNEALDIEIMYQKLNDLSEKPVSIDELCTNFKIPIATEVVLSPEEAYTIAILFIKLKTRLGLT
ncbi:MAG: 3'-5' exonuclease [Flavobacteriaceae bacterium]|nr:3'-5' exonuclease [Flavobacteriaceae bacterium]